MPESKQPALRTIIKMVVFTTLAIALLVVAGEVVKPRRSEGAFGGSWASFLSQPKNSVDVMVFGTSHAFTAVDPSTVWRAEGIPSFVLAGPVQKFNTTRYYVDEALRTQKPKVIVVEMVAYAYRANRFDSRFHMINVGYMPLSLNRLN